MSGAGNTWLGIDVGTQSVKALLVDSAGRLLAQGSSPLASMRHEQRHEQSPEQWVHAAAQAVRLTLSAVSPSVRNIVRGVAVCATSGSFCGVDAAGSPLGPGIMYDDNRAAALLPEIVSAAPEHWRGQHRQLGQPAPAQPTWALTKMVWAARAGLDARTTRFAHQGDVVNSAIVGGPVATDWSSALKTGFDLRERRWPSEVLAALDFDAALLPDVVAPGTLLGSSSTAWEKLTLLPAGTPLYAGSTDGCAGQFGAGALEEGNWHSVVGTTLVLKGATAEPVANAAAGVYSHLSPDGSTWLPGGASSSGAGALSRYLAAADLDEVTTRARVRWGNEELPVAYPLVAHGERFPLSSPDFTGFLVEPESAVKPLDSLNELADDEALTAIFVGLSAVERLCFERLEAVGTNAKHRITRLSTSGGGARSHDWVQLRASMLRTPIVRLTGTEGGLGMAALACWGAQRDAPNAVTFPEVAQRMCSILDTVAPDPALFATLDAAYDRFTRQVLLYEASTRTESQQ